MLLLGRYFWKFGGRASICGGFSGKWWNRTLFRSFLCYTKLGVKLPCIFGALTWLFCVASFSYWWSQLCQTLANSAVSPAGRPCWSGYTEMPDCHSWTCPPHAFAQLCGCTRALGGQSPPQPSLRRAQTGLAANFQAGTAFFRLYNFL